MRPDTLQNRPLTLVITPGIGKPYRLAFAGGSYFEVLDEFDTEAAVKAAKRAAEDATARLTSLARATGDQP